MAEDATEAPAAADGAAVTSGLGRQITWLYRLIQVLSVGTLAFHLAVFTRFPLDAMVFRSWHLALVAVFAYLLRVEASPRVLVRLFFLALAAVAIGFSVYLSWDVRGLTLRAGMFPNQWDVVFAALCVLIVLDLTWRTTGPAMVGLAVIFMLYGLFGDMMPEMIRHRGYDLDRMLANLYTANGIFSIPLGSSATFIYYFIFLGALLTVSGTGDYLMKLAMLLAGKTRGGPAKIAVLASGFFGMINGTSAGNVVSTGSLTIPLMKKFGYSPRFAAAVEASASSGGQILPPVMGAAAFLMIEMTGIPYNEIIVAAAVPALLYFAAILFIVHFEAVRRNMLPTDLGLVASPRQVLIELYRLIPVAVLLLSLLVLQVSIILAAIYTGISVLLVSWLSRDTAIGPRRFVAGCVEALEGMVAIAATCATAGIIIGILNQTGMGLKIAALIIDLTAGSLPLLLVTTMIVTIVLGMGMPTVAAYAITGVVVAPALVRSGVDIMAAHLFVMYFSAMSAITPPVALASYAAAAIARANVNAVGLLGMKLGLAGFLVPYLFVFHTELLLFGEPVPIVMALIASMVCTGAIAAAIHPPHASTPGRILLAGGAVGLIWPTGFATLLGLAAIAAGVALMVRAKLRGHAVPVEPATLAPELRADPTGPAG